MANGTVGRGVTRVVELQQYAALSSSTIVVNEAAFQKVVHSHCLRLVPVDVLDTVPVTCVPQEGWRVKTHAEVSCTSRQSELVYEVCPAPWAEVCIKDRTHLVIVKVLNERSYDLALLQSNHHQKYVPQTGLRRPPIARALSSKPPNRPHGSLHFPQE